KNEERLQYRKALLEAQNEAIPDAMLVVDTEGKILSYNHHFGELWGIPENILKVRDDTAALKYATTQLDNPTEYIRRVNYIYAHPGEPAHDEILFKDGRIIERYGNVVMADDGKRYGWAWYFRDITQNKNYANKIKDFNRDLEIKVKERTEELNKSEKRFRSLLENAHDLISLSDGKGKLFYVSPSVERITGYKIEESINQSVFAFVHPDDIAYAENIRQEFSRRPGESIFISFRYRHKNETYIWLEGTVINLLGDENVKAVVGNFHDVTERKISEESLRKSEKRFRSLIDNAHDIISLSDENGMRFYVSPAIERITGYTVEEVTNRIVFDIVYPDDVEHVKKVREEFMRDPAVIKSISCRFKHKNGGYVWIEGTLVNLLHDENVKAVVGNFHDVTERKISEEKIRISNERFEMVSRATNDAVWDWNLETDEIYWNDEIRSMFNYCAEDIATGAAWKVHIHPEDFKRVTRKLVYHVKNSIQNWLDEYRFRCADGSYKYVFNRGFILFDNNKKPYRIIGAMQDVTEINKLQQSLNEERIRKQMELTSATIQGQEKERSEIGRELHDNINQLLTATKLYLDVASKQPDMKDEMIERSVENISQSMEEIRRLSTALVPPSIEVNNFDDIIKDLIEPVKLATEINITYEVSGVNKDVLSNDQLLNVYRILQEHLNNILKHAHANNVLISVKHVNDHININITDDGTGFDLAARRKGIGFKNIQSRAELLNGKMKIVSKPGEGCSLVVKFPVDHSNP
ncbi:MAG TPA: PAS domain S-box protein, partial [Chitinophagaceae bacterium]|nr:PAS domain S-box protein [Chitinophagaceae bacterium]